MSFWLKKDTVYCKFKLITVTTVISSEPNAKLLLFGSLCQFFTSRMADISYKRPYWQQSVISVKRGNKGALLTSLLWVFGEKKFTFCYLLPAFNSLSSCHTGRMPVTSLDWYKGDIPLYQNVLFCTISEAPRNRGSFTDLQHTRIKENLLISTTTQRAAWT